MSDKGDPSQGGKRFDAESEAQQISALSRLRRRNRYRRSKLDRYRGELGSLYGQGLSFAQLALWLRTKKKIIISRSAIHRKMQQWPEVKIRHRGSENGKFS